ncbi:MAG: alkaline phosphatase family protein [Ignisphaera sp.]|nr:alkaline phosphatase family protein [Ignisphaera sp.]MCX8168188.1 alkaline phosphatase family protein [Ignisphaera sp.]MDW8084941.1 alkaline phosphatase family protein [Ignisphaera sp.]
MIKVMIVVIDGMGDTLRYRPTSLELASKPGMDTLAKKSVAGCFYPIDSETPPESDAAVFSLLGYDPRKVSIGRGLLEALGVGIKIKEGYEVAFRANFATIEPRSRRIVDRRVGRSLTSGEAQKLAQSIDQIELGIHGGYARVIASIGHRAVVVIGSREKLLSAEVSNTDPAYAKEGKLSIALKNFRPFVDSCKALDGTEAARITCELVNEFTNRIVDILENHPINIQRAAKGLPKANVLLLRDAENRYPSVEPINALYNKTFGIVAEMPVEKGIGAILGMTVAPVSPPTGDPQKDYSERLEASLKLLDKNDVVYVHLKGPDEPGHDGEKVKKVRLIEAIDRYFVQPLIDCVDLNKTAIIITSDHATPPELRAHSSDPVPVIVAYNGLRKVDGLEKFTEYECCSKGALGIIANGFDVLKKIFAILEQV